MASNPARHKRRLGWAVSAWCALALAAGCRGSGASSSLRASTAHPVTTRSPTLSASSATPSVTAASDTLPDPTAAPADTVQHTTSEPLRTSQPVAASDVGDAPTTATMAPPQPADPSYPPASDCSIDTHSMAAGTNKSCRFTATDAGGWWAGHNSTAAPVAFAPYPWTVVSVTRDGVTTHYSSQDNSGDGMGGDPGAGCGAYNTIHRGDLVEVFVTAGDTSVPADYEAGAGLGWSCGGHL